MKSKILDFRIYYEYLLLILLLYLLNCNGFNSIFIFLCSACFYNTCMFSSFLFLLVVDINLIRRISFKECISVTIRSRLFSHFGSFRVSRKCRDKRFTERPNTGPFFEKQKVTHTTYQSVHNHLSSMEIKY